MMEKNNRLFSISEVALKFGLVNKKNKKPLTHTLRFWETKFKQLRPTILPGGRRHYTIKDMQVIELIIFLLKDQCLTIKGAKMAMNENLKKLDDIKSSSIKALYYKKKIKIKSEKILKKINSLNGKKNTY